MQEEWRDVAGYERKYQISNLGNARSIDRVITRKDGRSDTKKGRLLKPMLSNSGYLQVNLYDEDANRKMVYLHRLVALHFLPNTENKKEVNHISGNKEDNRVSNLEWVDAKSNMDHAYNQNLTNFGRKKVICYNDSGFEKSFDSLKLAAEWIGEQRGSKASEGFISTVINGKYSDKKTAYSYKWKFVLEE